MRNLVLVCSLLLVLDAGDSDPSQMNVGGVACSGGAAGQGGGQAGVQVKAAAKLVAQVKAAKLVARVKAAKLVAQVQVAKRQCRSGRRPLRYLPG